MHILKHNQQCIFASNRKFIDLHQWGKSVQKLSVKHLIDDITGFLNNIDFMTIKFKINKRLVVNSSVIHNFAADTHAHALFIYVYISYTYLYLIYIPDI